MRHFLGDLNVENSWITSSKSDSYRMERREVRLAGSLGTGYLTSWFGAPFSEWLFILFCSNVVLVIDLFRDILVHLPPEQAHNARDVFKSSVQGTLRYWNGMASSGVKSLRGQLYFGHDRLVKQFLDAVTGTDKSPVPACDGWQTVKLIEDILNFASSNEL